LGWTGISGRSGRRRALLRGVRGLLFASTLMPRSGAGTCERLCDAVVEILAAKMSIARCRLHLENPTSASPSQHLSFSRLQHAQACSPANLQFNYHTLAQTLASRGYTNKLLLHTFRNDTSLSVHFVALSEPNAQSTSTSHPWIPVHVPHVLHVPTRLARRTPPTRVKVLLRAMDLPRTLKAIPFPRAHSQDALARPPSS
jgi:hypothetical protein